MEVGRQPDVYQVTVMVFVAASLPCTANYVLRKTADDRRHDPAFSPDTIEPVYKSFYMDDFLKSVINDNDAVLMQRQMTDLLTRGGFRLTKWTSSSRNVLSEMQPRKPCVRALIWGLTNYRRSALLECSRTLKPTHFASLCQLERQLSPKVEF